MVKKYEWLIALSVIVLFALFLQLQLFPNVADPDGFYHLRHSFQYRTEGLFQAEFPWAQYSAVRTHAADLWYGFHILLIPLTFLTPLFHGLYWGSLLVTIISLVLVFYALKRLSVRWPIFWTMAFALITADLLYRLAMLRPHPISLGLTLLLFSFLVHPPKKTLPTGRQAWPWQTFLIAAIFAWIHLSLAWVMVGTLAVIAGIQLLQKRGFQWRSSFAVIAGILAGWLLRPNPFGALKLAYIQVVKLITIKQQLIPLRFGRELSPFAWENFVDQLIPITILLILAGGFLLSLIQKRRLGDMELSAQTGIWSSGMLTAVFFIMTFGMARRSNELFVGFAVLFIALLFTVFQQEKKRLPPLQRTLIALAALIALIFAPVKNISRLQTYTEHDFPVFHLQPAAEWLSLHAKPGEIVFSPHWDRFGELFFWNPNNYYINGMDPIFEYDYDPELYWKTHFYATDSATGFTCSKIQCTAEEVTDTYGVLTRDFRAAYVIVEKRRSPSFNSWLSTAPKFEKAFENSDTTVYKIL